jgi:crotonobetainyl-CoA:carnitine CoA-transferase CaiB-like acyl-CoA transferase
MSDAALDGIRVIDTATLFAGPLAATMLGDYGADVIKVEHPRFGDPSRTHGHAKDGHGLWWKLLGRNKRTTAIDLSTEGGQSALRALAAESDVLIENFRPGTMERWHLGWEELSAINPRLIMVRVTGFGQTGPMSREPGFGTLAEAMSGFAAMTGEPGGPPTLPPFALADGVAGLATAYATMVALSARERSGHGQVVDTAIIEPMLTILGPQPSIYDQLGVVPERTGNRTNNNAPRNTYRSRDGRWLAVSTSSQNIAERVMRLVGRADLIEEPWFTTGSERAQHADVLDEAVGSWIAAHDAEEVLARFREVQAAIAPVYDVSDVMRDPQYAAREAIITIEDEELGPMRTQNVVGRLSGTPGEVRWTGRPLGRDTDEVLAEVGLDVQRIAELRSAGDIA